MVKISTRRRPNQDGQAVVLVILSISIFLCGAMGLAIDGSQLYAQRQMAQAAADAAAQAGIVTIFDGLTAIGTTAYYCTSANTTSPCSYASSNGFTAGACGLHQRHERRGWRGLHQGGPEPGGRSYRPGCGDTE